MTDDDGWRAKMESQSGFLVSWLVGQMSGTPVGMVFLLNSLPSVMKREGNSR